MAVATLTATGVVSLGIGLEEASSAKAADKHLTLSVSRLGTRSEVRWSTDDASSSVKIFRNGFLLLATKGSGYIQDNLESFETADYEVTAARGADSADMQERDVVPADVAEEHSASQLEVFDTVGVEVSSNGSTLNSASASPLATKTVFRYQTFIPMATVTPLAKACFISFPDKPIDHFSGDDRSYGPTASSFRTRLDATIDWSTGSVSGARHVGQTHAFVDNHDGTFSEYRQTAENTSMSVTDNGTTSSSAHFTLDQDVGNPFCPSNGIYVHVNVNVAKSGAYSMYGSRIMVPTHEVYIKDSDDISWTPVLKSPAENYGSCLLPGFACNTTVATSGTR